MTIRSINPANGKIIRTYKPLTLTELKTKVERASKAYLTFKRTSLTERSELLHSLADVLESRKEEISHTITLEMGKPIRPAEEEVKKCAINCRFFAKEGPKYLRTEALKSSLRKSSISYHPLGPILAIMPWNFPFWQVFRFAAPALMAGNTILLKHASNVPGCSLMIEKICHDAGFPSHVFQSLLVTSSQTEHIVSHPKLAALTLTGSVSAGSIVGSLAGKFIKKSVMELGGSDPFIVMPSANLTQAVQTAVTAKIVNSGQSCIAAKRFIVHKRVMARFQKEFVEAMGNLKIGNPLDEDTRVGPLATEEILRDLTKQVEISIRKGAKILIGGKRLKREGFFYLPTVLSKIPKNSPAYQEELFGPVASLFSADSLEDALRIANDTKFGLGASFWSENKSEQAYFAENIEAGNAFINSQVVSDPALPFGGIKQSGYGRELGSFGIREFVNIKTVSKRN